MALREREEVLITGIGGFLGSHLVRRLIRSSRWRVVGLTRSGTVRLPKPHQVIYGDLLKPKSWQSQLHGRKIHQAIHLAGGFGANWRVLLKENVETTASFLEMAQEAGAKQVILASSAAVYGSYESYASCESDELHPDTPYGLCKRLAEELCFHYTRSHRMRCWILRIANLYGPGATQGVVYQILTPLLKGKKVRIHGDGRQRRDFLYVDDCAEAFQHALERPAQGCEVVNVGSGRAWSLLELVEEMERVTGLTAQRMHDSAETHVTRVVWVQISRARHRLGWRPRTSLSEGLRTTASWIRSHGLRGETKR